MFYNNLRGDPLIMQHPQIYSKVTRFDAVSLWLIPDNMISPTFSSPTSNYTQFSDKQFKTQSFKGPENVKIITWYLWTVCLSSAAIWHSDSCCDVQITGKLFVVKTESESRYWKRLNRFDYICSLGIHNEITCLTPSYPGFNASLLYSLWCSYKKLGNPISM